MSSNRLSAVWVLALVGLVGVALHGLAVSGVDARSIQCSSVSTQFLPGSRCLLEWSVTNLHPTDAKQVTLRAGVASADPAEQAAKEMTVTLQPRETRPLTVIVDIPAWLALNDEASTSTAQLTSQMRYSLRRDPLIPRKGFVEVVRVERAGS